MYSRLKNYETKNPHFFKLLSKILSLFEHHDGTAKKTVYFTQTVKKFVGSPHLNLSVTERYDLEIELLFLIFDTIRENRFNSAYCYEIFEAILKNVLNHMEFDREWQADSRYLKIILIYYSWSKEHVQLRHFFNQQKSIDRQLEEKIFSLFFELIPLDKILIIYEHCVARHDQKVYSEKLFFNIVKLLSILSYESSNLEWHEPAMEWSNRFDKMYANHMIALYKEHENELGNDSFYFSFALSNASEPDFETLTRCFSRLKTSGFFLNSANFTQETANAKSEFEKLYASFMQIKSQIEHGDKFLISLQERKRNATDSKRDSLLKIERDAEKNHQVYQQECFQKSVQMCELICYQVERLKKTASMLYFSTRSSKLKEFASFNVELVERRKTELYAFVETMLTCPMKRNAARILLQEMKAFDVAMSSYETGSDAKEDTTLEADWHAALVDLKTFIQMMESRALFGMTFSFFSDEYLNAVNCYRQKNPLFHPVMGTENQVSDYFYRLFNCFSSYVCTRNLAKKSASFDKKTLAYLLEALEIAYASQVYDESIDKIYTILMGVTNAVPIKYFLQWFDVAADFPDIILNSNDAVNLFEKLLRHAISADELFQCFQKISSILIRCHDETSEVEEKVRAFDLLCILLDKNHVSNKTHLEFYLKIAMECYQQTRQRKLLPNILKLTLAIFRNVNIDEWERVNLLLQDVLAALDEKILPQSEFVFFRQMLIEQLSGYKQLPLSTFELAVSMLNKVPFDDALIRTYITIMVDQKFDDYFENPLFENEYQGMLRVAEFQSDCIKMRDDLNKSEGERRLFELLAEIFDERQNAFFATQDRLILVDFFIERMSDIQQMFSLAPIYHLKTTPFLSTVEEFLKRRRIDVFFEKIDSILNEFNEMLVLKKNTIKSMDFCLDSVWEKIHQKNPLILDEVLHLLDEKIAESPHHWALKIAKTACLLNMGCSILAHEYIDETLKSERCRFPRRFIHQMQHLNAISMEKMGQFEDALSCRIALFESWPAHYKRDKMIENFNKIISLSIKIGDKDTLEEGVIWITNAFADGLISEELAKNHKVSCLMELGRYEEAASLFGHLNPVLRQLHQSVISQANGALNVATDEWLKAVENKNMTEELLYHVLKRYDTFPLSCQITLQASLNQLFERMEEQVMDSVAFYSARIRFYIFSKQLRRAEQALSQYVSFYGKNEFYVLHYALFLSYSKLHQNALVFLSEHQPMMHKNHRIYLEFATCYAELGEMDEAKKRFEDLLFLFPYYESVYSRALRYFKNNEIPDLISKYQSVIKKHKKVMLEQTAEKFDAQPTLFEENQNDFSEELLEEKEGFVCLKDTLLELSASRKYARIAGFTRLNYTPTEYAQVSQTIRSLDLALPKQQIKFSRFDLYRFFSEKPLPTSHEEARSFSFWK